MSFKELYARITHPALIAEKDTYLVKFAESAEEIYSVQKLRYQVFNLEQGRGLESSKIDGVDSDEYDDWSVHLVVREKNEQNPIGTYRLILGSQMEPPKPLYSDREYEIKGMEEFLPYTLEAGRSCVSPAYRNGTVVALLWAGFSEIMNRSGMRYLTGCVSLENATAETAWALYDWFVSQNMVSEKVVGTPRKEFFMERPSGSSLPPLDRFSANRLLPPLLKGYLRMGAKICGCPAYDYEFKTWDYLILLDVAHLPERYAHHFHVHCAGA